MNKYHIQGGGNKKRKPASQISWVLLSLFWEFLAGFWPFLGRDIGSCNLIGQQFKQLKIVGHAYTGK